jgi:radical SAM protein with 4Fe4S-binding SPASM domain
MLAYAQRHTVAVHMNTNATLLDEDSIAQLKALGVREVIVGVDAFRPETYAKIRVGGDLIRVATNIETMINVFGSNGPRLILQFIVMPANENEAEPFRKYWTAKGAIVKIRRQQGWGELVASEGLDIGQNERFMPCPWLFRNCLVLWNGEVCQCDGDVDNHHSCGNVRDQSIKDIWQGEMRRRRARHLAGDFNFPPCDRCRDWQVGLSRFFYPDEPDRPYAVDEKS